MTANDNGPLGLAIGAVERAGFAVLPEEPDEDVIDRVAVAIQREGALSGATAIRIARVAYAAIFKATRP